MVLVLILPDGSSFDSACFSRHPQCKELVMAMVNQGATTSGSASQSFYCSSDVFAGSHFEYLQDKGFIRSLRLMGAPDSYQVTRKLLVQVCEEMGPINSFVRPPPLGMKEGTIECLRSRTRWELILVLERNGWKRAVSTKSKASPYVLASTKEYYWNPKDSGTGRLAHDYLVALALADALLSSGLKSLAHFQSNKYYSTVLHLWESSPSKLGQVVPNQPAYLYSELQKREKKVADERNNDASASHADIDFEVEPGQFPLRLFLK